MQENQTIWTKSPRLIGNNRKMTEVQPSKTSLDSEEVTEISYEKLLPRAEKSAIMFHHKFYLEAKIDLKRH